MDAIRHGRSGTTCWHALARVALVMLTVLAGALSALGTSAGSIDASTDDDAMAYVVSVAAEAGNPVRFQLRVPFSVDTVQLFFDHPDGARGRSDKLVQLEVYTDSGRRLPIDKSASGYSVQPGGEPFFADYSLKMAPTLSNPGTWSGDAPRSLRWDDYAYIGTDVLLQARGFEMHPVTIRVRLPDNWRLYVSDVGLIPFDDPVHFNDVHDAALLTGTPLSVHRVCSAIGPLEFVVAGTLPWPVETLATSFAALLDPLQSLERGESRTAHHFIIARYPGALRLNPLISSHVAGGRTLLHWIGVGTIDWWRKHTVRDFIALLAKETLDLAPDAGWFSKGLGEYAGLLLLFEAGLLSADEIYQSLRNMYRIAAHYSGPAWPSLAWAGMTEPKSHASERVLQFRSPAVAFLLDTELRVASSGTVSLLDWWKSLAAQQRMQPDNMLHALHLLPTTQPVSDWSAFADAHIFGTRVTPFDFDAVFNRWFALVGR